jgi:WD40 repeat protein
MEEAFAPDLIDETLALLEAHKEMKIALDDPMPIIIMGTLRADSFAGLCNRRDVAALSLATHRVAPLPVEYLSEIITRPLEVWRRPVRDVRIEPAVVERMIADARRIDGGANAGAGDVLPLVAIALRQLWDDHADTEWFAGLTENHYEETGGLSAIIDEQAKRALREVRKHAGISEAEVYEALIPAVAAADAHGNRVRAWAPLSSFEFPFKPALEILRDARLLHTDMRSSEAGSTTETVYSVAHEVVLRQWTGLAHALDQQSETLTLKARIRDEAAAWVRVRRAHESEKVRHDSKSQMDSSSYLLLEGDRLYHATTLDWPETESVEVSEYIVACEAKQAERAETLAERERRLEQARQKYLAARATLASDSGDHLVAIRLALIAWPPDENAEVNGAVLSALATAADRSAFRRQLVGHQGEVTAVAWSPDGKKVVSGSEDETLMLWNPETGEHIGEPMVGHHKVSSVAWSPDGHRLFGGYGLTGYFGGTLMLWDAETGKAVAESMVDELDVQSVDYSPDGRRVISGGHGNTMMLWDAETLESIGDPIRSHETGVAAVAWSPDERRLVSGSNDATLMLWDAESGEGIGEPMIGHKEKVTSVSWSPDGRRLVSGSWDGTFMIWNAETGERIGDPTVAHRWGINAVAWSPDGRQLISGGIDGALILWDSKDWRPLDNPMTGHEGAVTSVAWSPDGRRLISGSSDDTLIIWDVTSAKRVFEPLRKKRKHFEIAAWSPDAYQLVTGHADGTLRLWDGKTGERIGAPIAGHEAAISFLSWSPDGNRLLSGSSDGWDDILVLWDTNTWEGIGKPMNGHQGRLETVTWSPDGRRIVSVGNCEPTLVCWDAEVCRRIVASTSSHSCKVMSAAWSPDSRRFVSGGDDGTLMLWDGETGEPVGRGYIGQEEWINFVAWSPDARLLVCASWDGWEATLMLWDADTGRRVGQSMAIPSHHGKVKTIAWSPNGSRLVSGSFDRSLILWDVKTNKQVHTFMTAHNKGVISVAWSPDGRRLVSGCDDGMVIVWDAHTGEPIGDPLTEPLADHAWVTSLLWSTNGRQLMRLDSAGKLVRWDVSWERILNGDDLARAVVRRRLRGVEHLTEPELRILRELDGKRPDPYMIIRRWGLGGLQDDPFGDPLEESSSTEGPDGIMEN